MSEKDILHIIEQDPWMMKVLSIASTLNLKDWLIGAGFVRNKIWDHLSGIKTTEATDIDLVYFDPEGNDQEADEKLSQELCEKTGMQWEVVNQCYAHTFNGIPPYTSTTDAISQWVETVTAIGVTMENGKLRLIAPYGIEDNINFVIRPTPQFVDKLDVIRERVKKKRWLEKWPKLTMTF